MKVLVFHIGADRYAMRLRAIARVLPAAALRTIPLAPPAVAGLLDLEGCAVPVIDLSRLAGVPAQQVWFDSRIILIDYLIDYAPDDVPDPGSPTHQLGLLAEHVIGIEELDPATLGPAGVAGAPFLGQVGAGAHGLLQLVEPAHLLGPELRAQLFQDRASA